MRTREECIAMGFKKGNPGGGNTGNHGPYLTPLLKKLLSKKIDIEDPSTKKMIKATVKDALLWRLILNGTEGETQAIREILDRVDGKLTGNSNGNGKGITVINYVYGYSDKSPAGSLRFNSGEDTSAQPNPTASAELGAQSSGVTNR